MHSFTSSTLFIFIHLPSSTERSSWNFRTGIKANDWQQPSARGAQHSFSPALDILFMVLICVPVLMCVLVHLCPDTQLTPVEFICHTHSAAALLGNSSCHWGVGNTILHAKHAPMEKAFFQAFLYFRALTQKFLRKMFSIVWVFSSKRILKAFKHRPIYFICFFLFSSPTVFSYLCPNTQFVVSFFLMI